MDKIQKGGMGHGMGRGMGQGEESQLQTQLQSDKCSVDMGYNPMKEMQQNMTSGKMNMGMGSD